MANKRMLARSVTDDDRFSSMSSSAQALYLHLSMAADDDGFCNQVSICMFRAHASVSDLETLLDRRFLYQFDNGVIVIKHWRMANALRKDRYTPTNFQKELAMLTLDDIGNYHMQHSENDMVAAWLPDGCQMVATDKNRLDKDRLDKDRVEEETVTVSNDTVCWTQDVQRVTEAWNNTSLPHISKISLSSKRGQMLRARIAENGVDTVIETIYRANGSPFLKGQNNKGWMCTFDWFVKPTNFIKVMEGNYDTRNTTSVKDKLAWIDEVQL